MKSATNGGASDPGSDETRPLQTTTAHHTGRKWPAILAVQLVGATVCAWTAWPWLAPEAVPLPTLGPHLGATTDLEPPRPPLGLAPEDLGRAVRGLTSARVALVTPRTEQVISWEELGLTVVPRTEGDTIADLARHGYRFVAGQLTVPQTGGGHRDQAVMIGLQSDRVRALLEGLARRLDRTPIPSRWDFRNNRALGDVAGRRLAIEASFARLLAAAASGHNRVELVVDELPASVRRAPDLATFEARTLMATYSTEFNRRKRDRVHNLVLAASFIDGTILLPGAVLSYNETVGERSLERGFLDAPVIVQGEIVEGVGGGACQVSSTLHAASMFAGFEVLERMNHSLPSSYIGMGLDSVVAWPTLDLRIRNTYPHAVALHVYLDEDRLRAEIWGPGEAHRVVIRREVLEEIPFAEEVTVDPTLAEGAWTIDRKGIVGYRVARARMVWKDGKEEFERLPLDLYRTVAQKVRIGPNTIYPPPEDPEAAGGMLAPPAE